MLHVMLVDDEEVERRAIARIICENFNFLRIVYETTNGQDAVDYVLAHPVDIIFMDISMPVKNGIEAAQEIRGFNTHVQIIIVTAYSVFEYAKDAIDAKVAAYMLKPVNTAELKTVLEKIIYGFEPSAHRQNGIASLDNGLSVKHLRIIEQVKAIIRSDIRKELTIDEAAKMVRLHPDYFARIFKRKEGMGYKEYLIHIKMEKAKELLRTGMSVREICFEINYSDPNYFSRYFKKYTGLTASEYKESKGV